MDSGKPIGFDLVDEMPDYSKSLEENQAIFRERYKQVYGEEPPEFSQDKQDK